MDGFTAAEAEALPLLSQTLSHEQPPHDPQKRSQDHNTVDFNTPHDPENPYDWTPSFKWLIVALLALTNFSVTFTCVSVVPVASIIGRSLNHGASSKSASVLLVTIWELGEAAGPLFIAPLSERLGRLPVIATANTLFIVFTALAAVSHTPSEFVLARFLTGLAVACNVLNPAVVGDIFAPDQRGGAISVIMFAPLIGGAIGPFVSGAVAETLGWRTVVWGSASLMLLCQVLFLCFFRETYKVVILRRRAARLRLETGNEALRTTFDSEKGRESLWEAAMRPVQVFCGSSVLMWMCLFGSVVFAYYYVMSVTLADILEDLYGLSPAAAGSAFMCFSLGAFISTTLCHTFLDPIYVRLRTRYSGVDRPEFRLPLLFLGAVTLPFSMILYGWVAELRLPVPIMLSSVVLVGFTMILVIIPLMAYVVDAFGMYSASAVTGVIVSRCIMATFLPMSTTPLIDGLGYGWGLTFLAALCVVVAPIPLLIWRYGHRWRQASEFTRERSI